MANESIEMNEIEEVHQQGEDRDYVPNGEVSASEDGNSSDENKMTPEETAASAAEDVVDEETVLAKDNGDEEGKQEEVVSSKDDEVIRLKTAADINTDEPSDGGDKSSDCKVSVSSRKADESDVHGINDDDKDVDSVKNGDKNDEIIKLNDSEANDEDSNAVMMTIEDGTVKKNDPIEKRRHSSESEIIESDTTSVRKKVKKSTVDECTPRRSSRNLNKERKRYNEDDEDDKPARHRHRSSEKPHISSGKTPTVPKSKVQNTNQQRPMSRGPGRQPTNEDNTRKRTASNMVDNQAMASGSVLVPINDHLSRNQVPQQQSISTNPLPGPSATPSANITSTEPGNRDRKKCELCGIDIKNYEQLYNHDMKCPITNLIAQNILRSPRLFASSSKSL